MIDDCVHCGFCLDACPTYALWGLEADSPRGRIVLIGDALAPDATISDELATHLDRCLGCMACVPACPSGVRYDRLIERARPQLERNHPRPRSERALRRLLYETLPHPRRLQALRPLIGLGRRRRIRALMPPQLRTLTTIAPRRSSAADRAAPVAQRTPAVGEQRGRVGLLLGCVQRVFYPQVHAATVRVLSAEGFEVLAPPLPDCCGALELHGGDEDAGSKRARATIEAFAALGVDHVVVNAAGCGSAMKHYGELLDDDAARELSAKVVDVCELLASVTPRAPRGPLPLRVAYHDACHLAHAQGVREQPRELLRSIPRLELLEVTTEPAICCGSAGIYNVVEPEAAAELGQRKARHLLATGAELIAAGNPGCTAQLDLHLRALGHSLPVQHPIELLARAIDDDSRSR